MRPGHEGDDTNAVSVRVNSMGRSAWSRSLDEKVNDARNYTSDQGGEILGPLGTDAVNAGVAISTVRRLEGLDGPISANLATIERIEAAFERAGIEFIGNPNPGVRIMLHLNENRESEESEL